MAKMGGKGVGKRSIATKDMGKMNFPKGSKAVTSGKMPKKGK